MLNITHFTSQWGTARLPIPFCRRVRRPREGRGAAPPAAHGRGRTHGGPPRAGSATAASTAPAARPAALDRPGLQATSIATSPGARSAAAPPPPARVQRSDRRRRRCQVVVEHVRALGRLGRAHFPYSLPGRRRRLDERHDTVELGHSGAEACCGAEKWRAGGALGGRCGLWSFAGSAVAHMQECACGCEV